MKQVEDFLIETNHLHSVLLGLDELDFEKETQFKSWTINDILVHLHFWNRAVDLSLTDEVTFLELAKEMKGSIENYQLRKLENQLVPERGIKLLAVWHSLCLEMKDRWSHVDPKKRLKWVGPDMSARSSMSARQMETWAHGQAIFDLFGKEREETDRIYNILFLCVNAFGWSHKVHGLPIPETMPKLELISPEGILWEFGDMYAGAIKGNATAFCQVMTQTRNISDTDLLVEGEIAKNWMAHAQCFAGPPVKPPQPGLRFKQ